MIETPYVTIPLLAWSTSQLIKLVTSTFRGSFNLKVLYASGGMPSGHTALIVAISTTIGLLEGVDSSIFGLALALSMIIIYDALGVRRASGIQALAISMLYREGRHDIPKGLGWSNGHTAKEVIAGALLGFGLAILLAHETSFDKLGWFLTVPGLQISLVMAISMFTIIGISTKRLLAVHPNILSTNKKYMVYLPFAIGGVNFIAAINDIIVVGSATLTVLITLFSAYSSYSYTQKLKSTRKTKKKADI